MEYQFDKFNKTRKKKKKDTRRGLLTIFVFDYLELNSQFSIAFLSYL